MSPHAWTPHQLACACNHALVLVLHNKHFKVACVIDKWRHHQLIKCAGDTAVQTVRSKTFSLPGYLHSGEWGRHGAGMLRWWNAPWWRVGLQLAFLRVGETAQQGCREKHRNVCVTLSNAAANCVSMDPGRHLRGRRACTTCSRLRSSDICDQACCCTQSSFLTQDPAGTPWISRDSLSAAEAPQREGSSESALCRTKMQGRAMRWDAIHCRWQGKGAHAIARAEAAHGPSDDATTLILQL